MTVRTEGGTRHTINRLFPLALMFLTVGVSTAIVMPFLSLFLSVAVHAGPVRLTVFLVVAPLSAVLVSTLIGRLSDRLPIRRTLLIGGSVAGLLGSAATAVVRDYWVLLGLTVTATAVATTLFPQAFAYAREVLQRESSVRAPMAMSTLRTLFSIAWVGGPPLGAFLLDAGGFGYVYGTSAVLYGLTALIAIRWLNEIPGAPAPVDDDPDTLSPVSPGPLAVRDAPRSVIWLTAAGFTLMQCAGNLGVQAMPMFVGNDLHGDVRDVGLILGLCAALEIPLMLGFGALSTRVPLRRLILLGGAFGVAYFGLATLSTSVWHLAAGQLLNACLIAVNAGLGVSYVQDMLPGQPGRAATVFSNAFPIGAMLAGPLLGAAQQFGYRMAYASATALCLTGLLLLAVGRARHARRGVA
jgi:SET family sugar efflux transporter-like MFS transporter